MSSIDDDLRRVVATLTGDDGRDALPRPPLSAIVARTGRMRRARSVRGGLAVTACVAVAAGAVTLMPGGDVTTTLPAGPAQGPTGGPFPSRRPSQVGSPRLPVLVLVRGVGCLTTATSSDHPHARVEPVQAPVDLPASLLVLPGADVAGSLDSATAGRLACAVYSSAGSTDPVGWRPERMFVETHGWTPAGTGWSLLVVEPGDLEAPSGAGVERVRVRGGDAWWVAAARLLVWQGTEGEWFLLRTTTRAGALRLAEAARPAPADDPRWSVYLTWNHGWSGTPQAPGPGTYTDAAPGFTTDGAGRTSPSPTTSRSASADRSPSRARVPTTSRSAWISASPSASPGPA